MRNTSFGREHHRQEARGAITHAGMTRHRGAHPQDPAQFGPDARPRLRRAVTDLSWLRTRGYGDNAALELVGNRYGLKRRQRNAVARSACSDAERAHRLATSLAGDALDGRPVAIDGFNQLITLEAALGSAYVFVGRDGALRDVDPVQGTYRTVAETDPAIEAAGTALEATAAVTWHLDEHVSNVGRVRARLERAAARNGWSWRVEQGRAVGDALTASEAAVATSDSRILDRAQAWVNLVARAMRVASASNVVDLRPQDERPSGP